MIPAIAQIRPVASTPGPTEDALCATGQAQWDGPDTRRQGFSRLRARGPLEV